MKESDWKVFKKIKAEAVDRFCIQVLDELSGMSADTRISAHERYLSIYDVLHQRNKAMASMFDENSRSAAYIQLMLMNAAGLVDQSLAEKLSPELQQQLQQHSKELNIQRELRGRG